MITAPHDLSADDLLTAIGDGWSLDPERLGYAPVGFGSHHWWLTERSGRGWFVTAAKIDQPAAGERLRAAMTTSFHLGHRAGLSFVVAPVPMPDGALMERVGDYLVALFPQLEEPVRGAVPSTDQLITMVAAVHDATPLVQQHAPVEDFVITDRPALDRALDPDHSPPPGPYGTAFAELLDHHRPALQQSFAEYDRIADVLRTDRSGWVITHGEPKMDNTMITEDGPVLIDWDTVTFAPPERDVWMTGAADLYTARSGRAIDPAVIDFYRLRWDLDDLASFGSWFVAEHHDSPDTKIGWDASVRICAQLSARFGS